MQHTNDNNSDIKGINFIILHCIGVMYHFPSFTYWIPAYLYIEVFLIFHQHSRLAYIFVKYAQGKRAERIEVEGIYKRENYN